MIRQTIDAVRTGVVDEAKQREVVNATLKYLQNADLDLTPPEIGKHIYKIISEITGIKDLYGEEKFRLNRFILDNYGLLKKIVYLSDDPVYLAAKLSIVGNQFSFHEGDPDAQLRDMLNDIHKIHFSIDQYSLFLDDFLKARNILYLADNAGEIVFDKLFIEVLKKFYPERGHHFTVVVRGAPIINDATMADADMIDLDEVASVIDNGDNAPATLLHHVSNEMRAVYDSADLIISKGQGNFESLDQEEKEIYFLFRIKCPVISKALQADAGGLVLMHSKYVFNGIQCEQKI
jgi:uncharacterized protein with ATP-grasp and redox domains